jgi:hypothetical protein
LYNTGVGFEIRLEGEVQADGMLHLSVPNVPPGRVRVILEPLEPEPKERVLGRLKGDLEILPSFDDPIPGFPGT